jgi:hypothetical protein
MSDQQCVVVMAGNLREVENWYSQRATDLAWRDVIYAYDFRPIEGLRPARVVCLPGFDSLSWVRQNNITEAVMHAIAFSKTPIEIEYP